MIKYIYLFHIYSGIVAYLVELQNWISQSERQCRQIIAEFLVVYIENCLFIHFEHYLFIDFV